eukprot:9178325-Pyramimonas_sp.AAC.1
MVTSPEPQGAGSSGLGPESSGQAARSIACMAKSPASDTTMGCAPTCSMMASARNEVYWLGSQAERANCAQ